MGSENVRCDQNDPANIVEHREALTHLQSRGFTPLLTALEDERSYPTIGCAAGRPSVRAIARVMGVTPRKVTLMLQAARRALTT
jgi:hypothetical protein